jgi:hypothetical protein
MGIEWSRLEQIRNETNGENMKTYEVEIEGTQPYIMSRYPLEDNVNLEGTHKKVKNPPPEKLLHRSADGTIFVPGLAVYYAIRAAGKQLQIPGKGRTKYYGTLGSFVRVTPDEIRITPQKYELLTRALRKPEGPTIVATNPIWNEWALKFQIVNTNEDELPSSIVKESLTIAGQRGGLGTWRPLHGLFNVIKFKEI